MLPAEASQELVQWMQERMDEREWSMRETSMRAGLSANRINQIMRGEPPGIEACIAIAQLFDVQLELVMYLAGYPVRDPRVVYDQEVAQFADFLQDKPVKQRKKLLRAIRAFIDLGQGT